MRKLANISSLATAASPMAAVFVCTLAIFILSGMDAAMKSLVIAIGVYNTVMWRSLLATLVSGAAWFAGARSWPSFPVLRLHALRAAIIAIVLLTFFWGLARLPLAEAIGLSFVAPLFALFLAAILLGERIRRQAIWASLAGIAGVVLITAGQFGGANYSQQTMLGTAAVLISTVFYAYNLILARRQALLAKPTEIMFFQSLALSAIFLLPAPWLALALPAKLWLPLTGVTALSLGGQFLMTWSYARAEAQYLIPTEYSAFIWASAFGWFFFGEVVGWPTLAGACLIIAGCLIAARSNPKLSEPIEAAV
jgi:S-adenosylmethionine uptake transporter